MRYILGVSPLTVTVTTRIITFLVGDPYKPAFTTVTVRGPYPRYIDVTNLLLTSWDIHPYAYILGVSQSSQPRTPGFQWDTENWDPMFSIPWEPTFPSYLGITTHTFRA